MGFGDNDDNVEDGLKGILGSVKATVTPVTEVAVDAVAAVDDLVSTTVKTVDATVQKFDETVVTPVADTVRGAIQPALPSLPEPVRDALSSESAAFQIDDAADLPDGTINDTTGTAIQQLTAALWPLDDAPRPWSPRELILISAGSLSASTWSSGGAALCDIPFVERWLVPISVLSATASGERAPAAPTFDTDCTPD